MHKNILNFIDYQGTADYSYESNTTLAAAAAAACSGSSGAAAGPSGGALGRSGVPPVEPAGASLPPLRPVLCYFIHSSNLPYLMDY